MAKYYEEYPKYVYPNGYDPTKGVLVHNPEQEEELMGEIYHREMLERVSKEEIIATEKQFLQELLGNLGEKYDPEAPILELREQLLQLANPSKDFKPLTPEQNKIVTQVAAEMFQDAVQKLPSVPENKIET